MNDEQKRRAEALEFAAKAVAVTLSTLAQVGTLDHVDTSAMLHMLAQVLEHPEVMI